MLIGYILLFLAATVV